MKRNKKIYIIGNSGSGKSYLAKELHKKLNIKILHLDDLFWETPFQKKRSQKEILKNLEKFFKENSSFIIEGVYKSLERKIKDNSDMLIYLDLPWKETKNNLKNRKSNKIDYYGTYYQKERKSEHGNIIYSKGSHDHLFENFSKEKIKLNNIKEVNDFIESYELSLPLLKNSP